MARADLAHPSNAPGSWFVDSRCIRCDAARDWAPELIDMDAAGRSFVARQPVSPEQTAALWRAAAGAFQAANLLKSGPIRIVLQSSGSPQPALFPPPALPIFLRRRRLLMVVEYRAVL